VDRSVHETGLQDSVIRFDGEVGSQATTRFALPVGFVGRRSHKSSTLALRKGLDLSLAVPPYQLDSPTIDSPS